MYMHVQVLYVPSAIPKKHTIDVATMQTSVDESDTTVEHTVHLQVTGMMCQKSCGKEGRGSVLVSVSIALFSPSAQPLRSRML